MTILQKLLSYVSEVKLKKYHSDLNGNLYVNMEYGEKVLHTENANFSFQKLHKVMKAAIIYAFGKSNDVKFNSNSSVLNLGLGGGSTVKILREELSHIGPIISVEYDPVIIELAHSDFDIQRFPNHTIIEQDALSFMSAQSVRSEKFDIIICDLFTDREVPNKFKSQSFFNNLIVNLNSGGHLIFNYIQEKNTEPFFLKYIENLSDEYDYKVLIPVPENSVLVLTRL